MPSQDHAMAAQRAHNFGHRIYSVIFWLALVANITLLFFGALVVFLFTAPFDGKRIVQHYYSCFWGATFFHFNPFWRFSLQGREHLPHGSAVIASNHESLGDVLAMFRLYTPFKWVSKASVFKVPFLGWNMWFNRYIPLVRGHRDSVVKMMQAARAWIEQGVPVLMFPEGTRTPDGEVGPFKDGAFQLAVDTGCPIVPMALTGLTDALPKHGFLVSLWVHARIRVLPPVYPSDFGNDVDALRDYVREQIVSARDELRRQARGAQPA